ncbi:3-isopropylmalate dehydrogenase [candidate division FCPU426 bacterium]|nr:3-isopropylmalate dehydrogenase [candidate division FCPU426 bacterium]
MGKRYTIALLPGDGTGPEVLAEGKKVLKAAEKKYGFTIEYTAYDLGGDRYLKTGELVPDSVLAELGKVDSIYLGAIGHPDVKPGPLEVGILLRLRFHFDQYINLRPVKLYPNVETPLKDKGPADIDFEIIRENCGGIYTGVGGSAHQGTSLEYATQVMTYSRAEVDRCLRYAFRRAQKREKKQLTLVHKMNVLTHVGDLWFRAFHEMGEKEFPEVKRDYNHVDACTMWMVKNPEWYETIVTANLFGDIITDLGAMIQGGMGIAAGGNINPDGVSMFEPIGGSAPKYTGQKKINPMAAIGAGAMMLEHLGEEAAAKAVEAAIIKALESGKIKSLAAGRMGLNTEEIGDLIAGLV